MTLIKKYKFQKPRLRHEFDDPEYMKFVKRCGGFDPKQGSAKPLSWDGSFYLNFYLDSITAAIEAGLVDVELWPGQLFESSEALDRFLEALGDYDEENRIHDRWWHALFCISSRFDVAGFVTSSEIAEGLADALENVGGFKAQVKQVKAAAAKKSSKAPERKKTT